MHQLTTILIDDQPLSLELLSDYVAKTPFLSLVKTFTNPLEALAILQDQKIDLIFLDIQMPELNGLQFMKLLNGKSKVVFTTAYPNHALEGFELDIVDYLLKPVSFERFLKAAQKAYQLMPSLYTGMSTQQQPMGLSDPVLFLKTDYKIIKVFIRDILFIEGLKEYVAIHTVDQKIITLQTLKSLEDVLPNESFIRVHKSFIIALDKINSIERSRISIKDAMIPVGETYKQYFFQIINNKKLL